MQALSALGWAMTFRRLGISDESEQLATQVGELMVERYGSLDAAKETLKNDPVGVLGDLSTVLGVGGVGVAKTAGMASQAARKAGETTSRIGGKIEPLAAVAAPVGAVARIWRNYKTGSWRNYWRRRRGYFASLSSW